ncbi:hypothetical protein Zmor_025797 [Zophobas morio]|uniref:Peptidase S1 domain-containing protein n=1 Tax=Zophobas morio TaxID=2755281 RepID=A0AA38HSI7_9CUCU|nr:hypothetical protein Zmor_025797 [Zophobas morio]
MKSIVFLALVALAAAAPKGAQLQFRNLYKNPVGEIRTKPSPHIIGGQEAEPHSIPFQVFLEMYTDNGGWYCGGSLISANYVLTAGHCGQDVTRAVVTLGAHQLSEASDGQLEIESTTVTVHPDFDYDLIVNDISVIQLPEAVTFTDTISPVVLPTDSSSTYTGETARVSGWGLTDGFGNTLSDVLNYVDVRVISNNECAEDFGPVEETIVCTSGNDKTGSCSGDSGGPLVVDGVQIGIVSFGMTYCLPGYASAFTRVTSYLDWIAENTDVTF